MSLHLTNGVLQGPTAAAVCIMGLGACPSIRGWAVTLIAEQTWRLWMRCALVPGPVSNRIFCCAARIIILPSK